MKLRTEDMYFKKKANISITSGYHVRLVRPKYWQHTFIKQITSTHFLQEYLIIYSIFLESSWWRIMFYFPKLQVLFKQHKLSDY